MQTYKFWFKTYDYNLILDFLIVLFLRENYHNVDEMYTIDEDNVIFITHTDDIEN